MNTWDKIKIGGSAVIFGAFTGGLGSVVSAVGWQWLGGTLFGTIGAAGAAMYQNNTIALLEKVRSYEGALSSLNSEYGVLEREIAKWRREKIELDASINVANQKMEKTESIIGRTVEQENNRTNGFLQQIDALIKANDRLLEESGKLRNELSETVHDLSQQNSKFSRVCNVLGKDLTRDLAKLQSHDTYLQKVASILTSGMNQKDSQTMQTILVSSIEEMGKDYFFNEGIKFKETMFSVMENLEKTRQILKSLDYGHATAAGTLQSTDNERTDSAKPYLTQYLGANLPQNDAMGASNLRQRDNLYVNLTK